MQKLENRLVQLLFFLLPSQLALHFWPDYALIFGVRVDYLSPQIYLTDVLIVFIIAVHFWNSKKDIKLWTIATGVVLFSLINVAFAIVPEVAIFKWYRVLEYYLLANVVITNKTKYKIRTPLAIGATYTATIAFLQLILQRNVGGLLYWFGERPLSVVSPNMATFTFMSQEYLRPYATFPHPNVLGAFGLVTALILSNLKNTQINRIGFICSIFLIIVSFSEAIWLSALLIFLFSKVRLPILKLMTKALLVLLVVASACLLFITPNFKDFSVNSRIALANSSGEVIKQFPVFGAGLGNFVIASQDSIYQKSVTSEDTRLRFQPVHNIVLLLLSEIGIVGFFLFLLLIMRLINFSSKNSLLGLIVVFTTGFVDHYWITLHQGILLFVLIQWSSYETNSQYGRGSKG